MPGGIFLAVGKTTSPPISTENQFLDAHGTITSLNVTDVFNTAPQSVYDGNYELPTITYVDIDNSPLGYLQIQFFSDKAIQRVRLKGDSSGFFGSSWDLYASATGAFSGEEATIYNHVGAITSILDGWYEWGFSNLIEYEYYRMVPDNFQPWRLSEFQLYLTQS